MCFESTLPIDFCDTKIYVVLILLVFYGKCSIKLTCNKSKEKKKQEEQYNLVKSWVRNKHFYGLGDASNRLRRVNKQRTVAFIHQIGCEARHVVWETWKERLGGTELGFSWSCWVCERSPWRWGDGRDKFVDFSDYYLCDYWFGDVGIGSSLGWDGRLQGTDHHIHCWTLCSPWPGILPLNNLWKAWIHH